MIKISVRIYDIRNTTYYYYTVFLNLYFLLLLLSAHSSTLIPNLVVVLLVRVVVQLEVDNYRHIRWLKLEYRLSMLTDNEC